MSMTMIKEPRNGFDIGRELNQSQLIFKRSLSDFRVSFRRYGIAAAGVGAGLFKTGAGLVVVLLCTII
jgi:hypothetical protein